MAGVDHALGRPGRHVPRGQVAERRVDALEVVVPLVLGDLGGGSGVVGVLGDPDAPVVAQRLRHEGQLRLELVAGRDAGRVDLGVAGVGEVRALLVRPPRGGGVAVHGVGRQVEGVGVAAGAQQHGVAAVAGDLAGGQVPGDDAGGHAVLEDHVEHLDLGVELDPAGADLLHEGLVGAQQQLLAGLAPGVEGPRHLGAAEGAVVQHAAVLPGERHALGDALVDDVDADLGQAVHVGLARAEVAALHGVVEQPVDAVAVVLVVLGRVDAALGGDGVGPARRVVEGEDLDLVAELGQGGGAGGAGQAGAHHQDLELALVVRVHQPHGELVVLPAVLDGALGGLGVEHVRSS